MTTVTINGNTYSDDGTASRDMTNGGHRTWFMPLVQDIVIEAAAVAADAAAADVDAAAAAAVAGATKGTSTTSTAVGTGSKTLTTQTGKQFAVGNYLTIARTSAPTTLMHGVVTAYNSGTGSLTVDVSTIAGSGTFTDWTIALSGAQGNTGASGDGTVTYLAKTGAYTVTASDKAKLIDCTSGTFTLSFQAAASLGANWATLIRNSGTGDVTLDPNGAETIDGLASFVMYPGEVRQVYCDGTVLRSVVLSPFSRAFTSSGTFTKPPGYQWFGGYLWGGGGAGAKSSAGVVAPGGGGGACVPFDLEASLFGTTETITIAAGGVGPSAVSTAGANGGSTTLGSLSTAFGGAGGNQTASSGGGGGGRLSAASGSTGGQPNATVGSTADGLGGANATANAAWGGAGGSSGTAVGGASCLGGGGGGGVAAGGTVYAGGGSGMTGAGGSGADTTSGVDGSPRGGGGGGTRTGTKAGDGGRGELVIWGVC